jgi:predicted O-methyltransferase YrrM
MPGATSLPHALRRPARLAGALARDRLRYPALRQRPHVRTPAAALEELGFDRQEVERAVEAYHAAAAELFPLLRERAEAAGRRNPKLEQPDHPAHAGKQLLYAATRLARPDVVVETGTYVGGSATFFLRALADNGRGRLISLDLPARAPLTPSSAPARTPAEGTDPSLPEGHEPGFLIPDELRDHFELVLGDARETLPRVLAREPGLGLFMHDSLHTTRQMRFEYNAAWPALPPGGLLLSDDVFMTPAFWWFTRRRRLPFVHVGNVGIARKPGPDLTVP